MDLDPIKQLQTLLDDRSKVLEKISSIQSALGSIKRDESASTATLSPSPTVSQAKSVDLSVADDHVYGRLFQVLRDMQAQIEDGVRPLAQEVIRAEVARIRAQTNQAQAALDQCLGQIDQSILACVERVDEYQKKYAALITFNDRLMSLGAPAEPLSSHALNSKIDEAIQSRLEAVRQKPRV